MEKENVLKTRVLSIRTEKKHKISHAPALFPKTANAEWYCVVLYPPGKTVFLYFVFFFFDMQSSERQP